MSEIGTHTVKVTLVVKAHSSESAVRLADHRIGAQLREWFGEDASNAPPFPSGSLLFHSARAEPGADPVRAALEKSSRLMWSLMRQQVSRLPREALDSLAEAHQAAVDALGL